MPELSIIIVNYKSTSLILDSLNSIVPLLIIPVEFIIVDNFSNDNVEAEIKKSYPDIKFIQMGYNAGFARANNTGIENATASIVLLLNPDTLNIGNSIDQCFKRLSTSGYNAAGVQLINPDGSPQISGNFFITGGLNNLLPLPSIGPLIKKVAKSLKVKSTNLPDSSQEIEVDWLNGAFIMVKKSAIRSVGKLDPDFFLYAEEIEWCARLRKLGPLVLYGDLKFVHLQGATANEIFNSSGKGYYNLYDKKGAQILISNFLRIRKQYGVCWFLIHWLFYLLELPILFARFSLEVFTKKKSITKNMIFGFLKNLWILFVLTPRILLNRPYFYKIL